MWFQFHLNNSYSSKYSAMKSKLVEPYLSLVNVIRMTSPDPHSLIETIGAAGQTEFEKNYIYINILSLFLTSIKNIRTQ